MNIADELAKLEEMHRKGTLNDEEFKAAKAAVLGGSRGAAPTPVAQQAPPPTKEPATKQSAFLDPKANLKALVRAVIILAILGAGLWFLVSRIAGTKTANDLVKSVAHAPMTLRDSVENLPASSWHGVPLKLPYSGTLSVTVQVVSGNKIDVFLVNEENLEKHKAGNKNFRVFAQANKTQSFSQTIRLPSGLYYLVLRDDTLGVLSSSASDIKVLAKLE